MRSSPTEHVGQLELGRALRELEDRLQVAERVDHVEPGVQQDRGRQIGRVGELGEDGIDRSAAARTGCVRRSPPAGCAGRG